MAELDARRAEVLNSAAKVIQGRMRTHNARKRFIALREAAVCMQSLCRGELFKDLVIGVLGKGKPIRKRMFSIELHFLALEHYVSTIVFLLRENKRKEPWVFQYQVSFLTT